MGQVTNELGKKKVGRLEDRFGVKIVVALCNGPIPHGWIRATLVTDCTDYHYLFNQRTGEWKRFLNSAPDKEVHAGTGKVFEEQIEQTEYPGVGPGNIGPESGLGLPPCSGVQDVWPEDYPC